MDYQVLLKELEQNLQSGLTWGTVPVKSKMTLNPGISKRECFKVQDMRIKSRVWRIKLEFQALSFEVQEARFSCEIIFVQYNHVAIQKFAPLICGCGTVYCNCLNCQLRQPFNKCKSVFSVLKNCMYSLCSLCLPCSEIFTDEWCSSVILSLIAVLCKSR